MNLKKTNTTLPLAVIIILTISISILVTSFSNLRSLFSRAAEPAPISDTPVTKSVLVLIFNPVLEQYSNSKLTTYLNWSDPDLLTTNLINIFPQLSNSYLTYTVAQRQEIDSFYKKTSGYTFTDETYMACIRGTGPCNGEGINYQQLFTDFDICAKNVDEVWLWGGPWFGYWEFHPVTYCGKTQFVMGFNYERSFGEALHDFGHRMEFVGNNRVGNGNWQQNEVNDFNKFSLINGHCGNIHYPPGTIVGQEEYKYDKTTLVTTDCEGYDNYPGGPYPVWAIICAAWNCTQEGYVAWWLSHIPHNSGTTIAVTNGKVLYNNWWKYYAFYDETAIPLPSPTPIPTDVPPTPTVTLKPSPTPPPTPTPTPQFTCPAIDAWCSNQGVISYTVPFDVNNWFECRNWCDTVMNQTYPLCQYNADGPRNCWVKPAPNGNIQSCAWSTSNPPYGALWLGYSCPRSIIDITPTPTGTPTPTPSPSPTPTPTPSPTPTPTPFFSNLSSTLVATSATFNFTYSGTSSNYVVDMSLRPDMSWDTYLTFGSGSRNPIIVTNPTKWDQYVCGKQFYWTVKSTSGVKSSIQPASVYCSPTPTHTPTPTNSPTPTPISCFSADINKDGAVDGIDSSLIFENFFSTTPPILRADINNDGIVDITDYSILVTQFGQNTGPCI